MVDVKQVNVKLDPDDYASLTRCAELDKLSQSDVIRRAIRSYQRHLEAVHTAREMTGSAPEQAAG